MNTLSHIGLYFLPILPGAALLLAFIGNSTKLRAAIHYELPIMLLIPMAFCCFGCYPFSEMLKVFQFLGYANWICTIIFILPVICASAAALMAEREALIPGFVGAALLLIIAFLNYFSDSSSVGILLFLYPVYLLLLCVLGWYMENKRKPANTCKAAPENRHPSMPIQNTATVSAPPTLRCISGIFAGAEFSLKSGEIITIGSDPARCQIILSGDGICSEHFRLWFDQASGSWSAIDLSGGNIYHDGVRLLNHNNVTRLPRGTVISLGQGKNRQSFRLE